MNVNNIVSEIQDNFQKFITKAILIILNSRLNLPKEEEKVENNVLYYYIYISVFFQTI
jgi:hypothetical protein